MLGVSCSMESILIHAHPTGHLFPKAVWGKELRHGLSVRRTTLVLYFSLPVALSSWEGCGTEGGSYPSPVLHHPKFDA